MLQNCKSHEERNFFTAQMFTAKKAASNSNFTTQFIFRYVCSRLFPFLFFSFFVIVCHGIRSKCCSGKQVTIVSEHTYWMKNSNNKIKFIEAQHEDFCNRSVVQFAYCFSCIIKCFSGDMNMLIGYEYHDVRTIYRKLNKVAFFSLSFLFIVDFSIVY